MPSIRSATGRNSGDEVASEFCTRERKSGAAALLASVRLQLVEAVRLTKSVLTGFSQELSEYD